MFCQFRRRPEDCHIYTYLCHNNNLNHTTSLIMTRVSFFVFYCGIRKVDKSNDIAIDNNIKSAGADRYRILSVNLLVRQKHHPGNLKFKQLLFE